MPTFQKPRNLKYVDMCKYVDAQLLTGETPDQEVASTVYQYLYFIIYMLSVKEKFFHKEEYYDRFALSTATDVYHRFFTNPKLNAVDLNGESKMKRIKSCLNYIKAILYGRKVAFEQNEYSQKYISLDETVVDTDYTYTSSTAFNFDLKLNMELYFSSVAKTIKHYLWHNCPYIKDKLLMKNIYLSCLISIIKSISFTFSDESDIITKYKTPDAKYRYLCNVYKANRDTCITLYHLDESYHGYITLLVRQLYTLIGKDIQEITHSSISIPEEVLINISFQEILDKNTYDY